MYAKEKQRIENSNYYNINFNNTSDSSNGEFVSFYRYIKIR